MNNQWYMKYVSATNKHVKDCEDWLKLHVGPEDENWYSVGYSASDIAGWWINDEDDIIAFVLRFGK